MGRPQHASVRSAHARYSWGEHQSDRASPLVLSIAGSLSPAPRFTFSRLHLPPPTLGIHVHLREHIAIFGKSWPSIVTMATAFDVPKVPLTLGNPPSYRRRRHRVCDIDQLSPQKRLENTADPSTCSSRNTQSAATRWLDSVLSTGYTFGCPLHPFVVEAQRHYLNFWPKPSRDIQPPTGSSHRGLRPHTPYNAQDTW